MDGLELVLVAADHARSLGALVSWAFIFWFLGFHFQVPGLLLVLPRGLLIFRMGLFALCLSFCLLLKTTTIMIFQSSKAFHKLPSLYTGYILYENLPPVQGSSAQFSSPLCTPAGPWGATVGGSKDIREVKQWQNWRAGVTIIYILPLQQ